MPLAVRAPLVLILLVLAVACGPSGSGPTDVAASAGPSSSATASAADDDPTPSEDSGSDADGVLPPCQQIGAIIQIGQDREEADADADAGRPATPQPSPLPELPDQQDYERVGRDIAPDGFGGVTFDADGVVLAFTPDVDLDEAAITAGDTLGVDVGVIHVAHTYDELEAARDELLEVATELMEDHPGAFQSFSIATYDNAVAVGLLGEQPEVQAALAERFGDLLCVEISRIPDEDDATLSPWTLDGVVPPGATEIPVLVEERACASGNTAEGRVRVLDITYEDAQVVIALGVIPRAGNQNCQSNPPTPFTVELDEPVGDRALVDAFEPPPPPPEPTHEPLEGEPWTIQVRLEDLGGQVIPGGFRFQFHSIRRDGSPLHIDWDQHVAFVPDDSDDPALYESVSEWEVAGPWVEVGTTMWLNGGPEQPTCRTAVYEPDDGVATLTVLFEREADGTCARVE